MRNRLIPKRYFDHPTPVLRPMRMQKQQWSWNSEPAVEIPIQRDDKPSTFLQLAEARARHRKIRIVLPLPQRQECSTKRAMLAALRETELTAWQASGGDFLARLHQP